MYLYIYVYIKLNIEMYLFIYHSLYYFKSKNCPLKNFARRQISPLKKESVLILMSWNITSGHFYDILIPKYGTGPSLIFYPVTLLALCIGLSLPCLRARHDGPHICSRWAPCVICILYKLRPSSATHLVLFV